MPSIGGPLSVLVGIEQSDSLLPVGLAPVDGILPLFYVGNQAFRNSSPQLQSESYPLSTSKKRPRKVKPAEPDLGQHYRRHDRVVDAPRRGERRQYDLQAQDTIYGSLALDGRQLFRTYDRFNAPTFVVCLKELQKHFGKAVVITDRAPQHRSKLGKGFLPTNKNIRIMYFPKGSPYLNAVEECWRRRKRRLLASEYYRTFSDMCRAVSTYYRTARFNLELIRYSVDQKFFTFRDFLQINSITSILGRAVLKYSDIALRICTIVA